MALGHSDFSFLSHIEPSLLGVHISFRSNPRGSVGSMGSLTVLERAFSVLVTPLSGESDSIFSLYTIVKALVSNTSGWAGSDSLRSRTASDNPVMEINVMRVQVVRNITRLTSPCFKSIELMFRLRHVGNEVRWVSESSNFVTSVRIHRVKPLMDFNGAESVGLSSQFWQGIVLFKCLYGRLSDHDMKSSLKASLSNIKVGIIGGENDGYITRRESLDRSLVSFSINNIICGPGFNAGRIITFVHLRSQASGHVLSNVSELVPISSAHADSAYLSSSL
jgi:hypothetical protein